MNIDPNDPRLTAYALGELDDEERAEVEALLEQSPAARRAVAEIQETADLLTDELQAEPCPGLSTTQREAIEAEAARTNGRAVVPGARGGRVWRGYWIPAALAASILIVVGAGFALVSSLDAAKMRNRLVAQSNLQGIGKSGSVYAQSDIRRELRSAPRPAKLDRKGTKPKVKTMEAQEAHVHAQPSGGGRGAGGGDEARVFGTLSTGENARLVEDRARAAVPLALGIHGLPAGAEAALQGSTNSGEVLVQASPTDNKSFRIIALGNTSPQEVPPAIHDFRRMGGISYGYGVPKPEDVRDLFYRCNSGEFNTESYDQVTDNPFLLVVQDPLSTFSIDVDTASYANVRRFLNEGQLPPKGAVRIEEMVNYFDYDYPLPTGDDPFSVNVDVAECPWEPDHLLARIGLKGWEVEEEDRPPANLVFLIDVSGSMRTHNKLPLLRKSMKLLVQELPEFDRVALVVYAGASGLVLPSTPCTYRGEIVAALDRLRAGGSTNGGAGIQLAYEVADENFIEGGINRVILATDGDFNVGVTNRGALTNLIEEKARGGVFLSVLGFGMGNLKDSTLETLADKGNGNYAYIDTIHEAQKVLIEQMSGTLMTIAKDVKIQIEFNPAQVNAYRLIGYENRLLAAQDFNDDTKDAGEIGAGHTVTAFYEIVPAGVEVELPDVDPLKYQTETEASAATAESGELMTVKLRYKEPDGETSKLIEVPVADQGLTLANMSDDFVFAASVASFGILLRDSPYQGSFTLDAVIETAEGVLSETDEDNYRTEFIELVRKAAALLVKSP